MNVLGCAAAILAAALASPLSAMAAEPPRNKALHALFEREFVTVLREVPEIATFYGIPGYGHAVVDMSPAAVLRRRVQAQKTLRELRAFDPRALNASDHVSRAMMIEELELKTGMHAIFGKLPFGDDLDGPFAVTSVTGPHQFYPYIVQATAFETVKDYEDYLKRLAGIPGVLGQVRDRLEAGIASGWTPPRAAMQAVPSQFDALLPADVADSVFFAPFRKWPQAVAEGERERLAAAGRALVTERVQPAFRDLKTYLETRYIPQGRETLGASQLPGGMPYYANLVRTQTTTSLSPEAIHEIGLAEVARIRAEMEAVIRSTGFQGDFAAFLQSIRADKRFYFTRAEDALAHYRDLAKRADAELPRLFAELPRVPYGIRAMDATQGDNAERYIPPALDGSRPGWFEANVVALAARPTYDMEATLLHEAVPGHHLQNARALELKDLPRFRRTAWYVAYGEGWALYAEYLGYEMGFFKDPYNRFGALSAEMLRACRLVIDTGLHAKGWGREQAIRYLAENSGVHENFAIAEIDRYINIPGQALGYKIGQLKILELRKRAAAALGGKFDLRRFHNVLLDDGPVPLTVLEARVDAWIGAELAKSKKN